MSWQPVIQLNIISSIRTILSTLGYLGTVSSGRLSPVRGSDTNLNSASGSTVAREVNSSEAQFPVTNLNSSSASHLKDLATPLLQLFGVEDILTHSLGVSTEPSALGHAAGSIDSRPVAEINPNQIYQGTNAEFASIPPEFENSTAPLSGSKDTQTLLRSLCGDMKRLWEDDDVQTMLRTKNIHLEDSPGL